MHPHQVSYHPVVLILHSLLSYANDVHLGAKCILRIATRIAPSLGCQDLVVVCTQVEISLLPGIKVVLDGDSAAVWPLGNAIRNVLREGGSTGDGWLIDLRVLPDLVGRTVALEGADLRALRRSSPV